jgi:hypothetical protein
LATTGSGHPTGLETTKAFPSDRERMIYFARASERVNYAYGSAHERPWLPGERAYFLSLADDDPPPVPTALYTRVANTTIRAVTSPLDRLAPLIEGRPRPEA